MLRTTIYIAAAVALAATVVIAADFSDKENTFRLTAPIGWTPEKDPIEEVAVSIDSPRVDDTGGNCSVLVEAEDSSKLSSQAEIDQLLAREVNEKFWKDIIAPGEGIESSKLEQSGEKNRKGRRVFYAKATSTMVIDKTPISLTQLMELQAIPGRFYIVACSALTEGFDREAADFEAILSSFEPQPFLTVSAARPRQPSARGTAAALARATEISMRAGARSTRPRR